MINLKQLLNEVTSHNFRVYPEKNASKVGSLLNKIGFRGVAPDRKALARIKSFEGGKMFTHIQYHVIATKLGHVFIHQSQHYLRDEEVRVTKISVDHLPDSNWFEDKNENRHEIGTAFVDTDKFLAALKRVNVIKRAS